MSYVTGHNKDIGTQRREIYDNDLKLLQSGSSQGAMASWFAALQKPFKSRSHANHGMMQPSINGASENQVHSAFLPLPLTSNHSLNPEADFASHVSTEGRYDASSNLRVNDRIRQPVGSSGDQPYIAESMRNDLAQTDEPSATPHYTETSDDTPLSHRMGSANSTSKGSGGSSHTSVGPPVIKVEQEEEVDAAMTHQGSPTSSSLSSQLSPPKSITPIVLESKQKTTVTDSAPRTPRTKAILFKDLRPRTSIPSDLPPSDLAHQSIHAAYSSRLNPFALHPNEYQLLREHLCHLHVTAYLNIRNRILRLWVRNPLVSVTAEEAAGCAFSSRYLGLAQVAYEWLIRRGYINFGCVEIPDLSNMRVKRYKAKRLKMKTVIVVGAGMAGLSCARQLEGLFTHYRERWTAAGEEPPKVVVLEGRNRVGGRVYSHPLQTQMSRNLPEHSISTAEMGAHIITGFDHGNPLSMIIRGQLALHYYPLKDNSRLYDVNGDVVEKAKDVMVEKLFNDILDRASVYRHRSPIPTTVEGNREFIEAGRDPQGDSDELLSTTDAERSAAASKAPESGLESVPGGVDKLTGKAHMVTGSRTKAPPALAAQAMGWQLPSNVLAYQDLNLDCVAKSSKWPTLGAAMDEAVKQYQFLLDLSPQDMRLLNWHYANLEYANAVNVGKLSLAGWDQDIGNEFEGEHAQVIGGYQQVPRALWQHPTRLDIRTKTAVTQIKYHPQHSPGNMAEVICDNGEVVEADHVVLTAPLGVLKRGSIAFDPALPDWKTGPIQRLGFGKLNKVILVYDKPFWNVDQDMFGLLREAEVPESLDQEDYVANRGRFYLFWNCIKTTGLPLLIALMAGDAAHQAENTSDADLVAGVTQDLALMFKQTKIPLPIETIVTRWGNDRFARGTYSYVGATAQPGDYEAMAKPIGNLHFAGEATCGTHPATVHGAYISGLRAASDIIDEMLGPIEIPFPLVPAPTEAENIPEPSPKSKIDDAVRNESTAAKNARLDAFENEILQAIYTELGYRPSKPGKTGANPFLLFTKDKWAVCKKQCDEARRAATGHADTKASRDEVRVALGRMWREAPAEVKRPYMEQTNQNRAANSESAATFQERLAAWDEQAMNTRRRYVEEHPGVLSPEEELQMWAALGIYDTERRPKKMSGHAEDDENEAMDET
ncbi:MAG: hypothetical protein Q9191_001384 [Dirinaria sp. TL-2023a]